MKIYITILLLFVQLACQAQILTGKVVRIADGDSFTLLVEGKNQIRIRLHGIDCPERGQPYSRVAKDFTRDLLSRGSVKVEQTDVDRYGRVVGIVIINDSINLNERLLQAGLAWHYSNFDKNPDWRRLEAIARQERVGLWKESNPTAPWDYRKLQSESRKKSLAE